MIIELTPAERYAQETLLPQIFENGFHPERIDWYTRLVVESRLIKGDVIPEFIAAMIMESGLDNRRFHDANPDPHFGLYWVALDSTGHMPLARADIIRFRADPLVPLQYVAATPDLAKHGGEQTWFNKARWNAWKQEIIDPVSTTVWSPLKAARAAYARVLAS